HAQRLDHPLKRVGDRLERISWDQAASEIAEKLKGIIGEHGPRALAYMGGGGQGCHFEAAFGVRLLRGLGSRYHYSPLAQELTGEFWVQGRALGRQYLFAIPDERETELLLCVGWNPWMSHQMPQARRVIDRLSKDPDRLLVVIDPRRSETAARADIHLAVRPGADALLTRAMIAVILDNGWQDREYLAAKVEGFEKVKPWFRDFDAREAVRVCGLDYRRVVEVCRLLSERRWCMHSDLGVLMNRHSTLTSYLHVLLMAVCGRIGARGGNVIPGTLMPLGAHSDERNPKTWRTAATGFPAITGVFPPNVMPEEILSGRPDRLRAVIVSQSNPLRSYADTTAYEEAFRRLDLLVTVELALTETAALSHYVLPSRSGYESSDGTFFPWTFPEVYFQMRRPVVEPGGERREASEIFTLLADKLGLCPEIPESLVRAAQGDRLSFGLALMEYASTQPKALPNMPFILARTLGRALGSANLAALWGMLMTAPKTFVEDAVQAGFKPGPTLGEEIFQAVLDHPEGLWIGRSDPDDNLARLQTPSGKVEVYIPELADWLTGLDPASEEEALKMDDKYPFILNAGRHMDFNANTLMRDPAWNKGKRACTAAMNPEDAARLGLADGQRVRIVTEAGSGEIELETTRAVRPGMVLVPHGFGLEYQGRTTGLNVNRLTKNTHRDPFAATPLHRYVPCRVEVA
ncbi:MAG: molybdopterin-dependent oxidoreductase, partial [Thermodesulfobacteriota bacterium]